MSETRYLMNMTHPEAAEVLGRNPMVVIPTGSVEQHGPHLPFGTDYYAARVIGEEVARNLDAVLLPFSPIGVTPLHMAFAGTLTLRQETFAAVLEDVVASVARHGVRRVLILNWHVGNIPAIDMAAANVMNRFGLQVVVAQACYVAQEHFGPQAGGLTHGGELEVLPLLRLVPEHVHLERATNPSPPAQGTRMDKARRNRHVYPLIADVRWIAPTGWYGEPQRATAEKAEVFVREIGVIIARNAAEAFAALEDAGHVQGDGPHG